MALMFDIEPGHWVLPAAVRSNIARDLARQLGADFEAPAHGTGAILVRHRPTGIEFGLVAGGLLRMGLTEAEREVLLDQLGHVGQRTRALVDDLWQSASPVHDVRLPPFLCSRTPLLTHHVERRRGRARGTVLEVTSAEVRGVLRGFGKLPGLRLLSEAEWEWVARDGGHATWLNEPYHPQLVAATVARAAEFSEQAPAATWSRLGFWGLACGEWVADTWHANYHDAPTNGHTWGECEAPRIVRGMGGEIFPWQEPIELSAMLAGWRFRIDDPEERHRVRVALDLTRVLN